MNAAEPVWPPKFKGWEPRDKHGPHLLAMVAHHASVPGASTVTITGHPWAVATPPTLNTGIA